MSYQGGHGSAVSQSIYPNSFTTQDSINFMLNCFLGGLGYVFGPIVGTFVLLMRNAVPTPRSPPA